MELPTMLSAGLERVLNQVLRLDPDLQHELPRLAGKVIAIEMRGLDLQYYLAPGETSIQVLSHYEGEPDTVLSGTPLALARIGASADASSLLFAGDVEIRGDIDYGRRFREFLGRIDIDWEEQLSRVTGDIVAHQIGNAVRGLQRWGEAAQDSLRRDTADYLQYELRLLPTHEEAEAFMHDIDTLRSDADRLAARIERLRRQLQQPEPPNNG